MRIPRIEKQYQQTMNQLSDDGHYDSSELYKLNRQKVNFTSAVGKQKK